jgi:hypothetical protein
MACIAEIDAGSAEAQKELLFLAELLLQLRDRIDPRTDISGSFGFSDIYRCPTCRAGDFIRLNKVSVSLIKDLAAFRVRALERVRHLIEVVDRHGINTTSYSSCANAENASPVV